MSREVRMVPGGWKHPKDENGNHVPLLTDFRQSLAEWEEGKRQWALGFRSDYNGGWKPKEADETMSWEDWDGPRPEARHYMPEWPPEQRTHWCMYETTSEGTPISPVFATPQELARWLTDNRASAFAGMTARYEQWLATCLKGGAALGMVIRDGLPPCSGVELNAP